MGTLSKEQENLILHAAGVCNNAIASIPYKGKRKNWKENPELVQAIVEAYMVVSPYISENQFAEYLQGMHGSQLSAALRERNITSAHNTKEARQQRAIIARTEKNKKSGEVQEKINENVSNKKEDDKDLNTVAGSVSDEQLEQNSVINAPSILAPMENPGFELARELTKNKLSDFGSALSKQMNENKTDKDDKNSNLIETSSWEILENGDIAIVKIIKKRIRRGSEEYNELLQNTPVPSKFRI